MKLIYCWIENYKNIHKTGFNFSDEYSITVNCKSNTYDLKLKKSDNSIKTLLFGDNVSLSAIVGNNGVGKSTVLDLIRIMLFDSKRTIDKDWGFCIWKQGDEFLKNKFCSKQIRVNGLNISEVCGIEKFDLIYYSDSLDIKHYYDDFDDGESVETSIDEDEEIAIPTTFKNRDIEQYNVSTAFLLKQYKSSKDTIKEFFQSEVSRQLDFYSDNRVREIFNKAEQFLKIPNELVIGIKFLAPKICEEILDDYLDNYAFKNVRDAKHGGNYTESITIHLLQDMQKIYDSIIGKRNYKDMSDLNITIESLDNILCWNLLIVYVYMLLESNKENDAEKDDYEYVDEQLKNIIEEFYECKNKFSFCSDIFMNDGYINQDYYIIVDFYKKIEQFKQATGSEINIKFKFSNEIIDIIRESTYSSFSMNNEEFILKSQLSRLKDIDIDGFENECLIRLKLNGKKDIKHIIELYTQYKKIACYADFFELEWGMSTGEFNIFSIFARIYNAINKVRIKQDTEVMILMDEIDSSFHPNWQQIIINELVEFLKNVYSDLSFQVILTTHSPVLLSDIPKKNVFFLQESEKDKNHEETFAANISSLYYDSFFMKKGSIGNLAHKSINNLIKAMSSVINEDIKSIEQRRMLLVDSFYKLQQINIKEYNDEDYIREVYNIRNLINTVGEKIWKYKLEELFIQCNVINENSDIDNEFIKYIKHLKSTKGEAVVRKILKELKEKNK